MNPKPDLDLERISEKVFAWTLHFSVTKEIVDENGMV